MFRMTIMIWPIFLIFVCTGCSSGKPEKQTKQQAITQVIAPFTQAAITLNITAEPGMNSWNSLANSCTILIIQTQRLDTLNKLVSTPALLRALFSGSGAMDDILRVDRYAAMPGQQTTLHLDRNENVRQIAVIAGYYPFPKKQDMALYAIPVATTESGWWHKNWHAELTPLTIDITLGSQTASFTGAPQQVIAPTQSDLNTVSVQGAK